MAPMPTEFATPPTITHRLEGALAALAAGGSHQSVATLLELANVRGGTTGSNNPVAVWLSLRVPGSGPWTVGGTWVDERLFYRGQFLPVPNAVQDFLEMWYAGRYRHLRAGGDIDWATPQVVAS